MNTYIASTDIIQKKAAKSLDRLRRRMEDKFADQIPAAAEDWNSFLKRLESNFPRLFELYYHLYGSQYDFFFHLEELITMMGRMWFRRSDNLKLLDKAREADPIWFKANEMIGGVIYVDLFADDLAGVKDKIPYFKELGLTYLHLMPLFKVPEGDNDGGYAVSSYREVDSALGTMDQLRELAGLLRKEGISLVLDFIFNHTSDEHIWAQKAKAGDPDFQEYYYMFPNRIMPDAYEVHLREIFPEEHPGAFTFFPEIDKWVWTTFHTYQWDLNYSNPVVFNHMAEELLFLANVGVEVLRLDAVAFIWKELGTNCENLPEAHMIIQAFNAIKSITAPALLFKSEAIVHPDEVVKYIGPNECELSYNPLLMALLWNTLATRQVSLLRLALIERFEIPDRCAWVNYVRVHDDIGWTFSDEDAASLNIKPYDHRQFLNRFYTGQFEGSFARGLPFQENPATGDARISGTCASLAGLEKALIEETEAEVELAIRRILAIHAVISTIGGIPLIYVGDEIGTLNDYSYRTNPNKARDSRWVHRPHTDWEKMAKRKDPQTIEGRIYQGLRRLVELRKDNPVFSGDEMEVISTPNEHVLGYLRVSGSERVLVFVNFSESEQTITANQLRLYGLSYTFTDLLTGETLESEELSLHPYQYTFLKPF